MKELKSVRLFSETISASNIKASLYNIENTSFSIFIDLDGKVYTYQYNSSLYPNEKKELFLNLVSKNIEDKKLIKGFNINNLTPYDFFLNDAILSLSKLLNQEFKIVQDPWLDTISERRNYGYDPYFLNNSCVIYIKWFNNDNISIESLEITQSVEISMDDSDTIQLESSIDSLELVDSVLVESIDSIELLLTKIYSVLDTSVDSLELALLSEVSDIDLNSLGASPDDISILDNYLYAEIYMDDSDIIYLEGSIDSLELVDYVLIESIESIELLLASISNNLVTSVDSLEFNISINESNSNIVWVENSIDSLESVDYTLVESIESIKWTLNELFNDLGISAELSELTTSTDLSTVNTDVTLLENSYRVGGHVWSDDEGNELNFINSSYDKEGIYKTVSILSPSSDLFTIDLSNKISKDIKNNKKYPYNAKDIFILDEVIRLWKSNISNYNLAVCDEMPCNSIEYINPINISSNDIEVSSDIPLRSFKVMPTNKIINAKDIFSIKVSII